jgi:uncharacterized protein YbjT (DUF2867 family)
MLRLRVLGNSNETGSEEETRQGTIAAEAVKDAGVWHLIYSSVTDANKKTGIPHFESKYLVEQHVAGLGIPYTISAPASSWRTSLRRGRVQNRRFQDASVGENTSEPRTAIGEGRQSTHVIASPLVRLG